MGKALTFPARATLTLTGLELPEDLTYEEWLGVMAKLFTLEKVTNWAIGDALYFGERKYGERYAHALALSEATGINVDSIRNAMWVSERVPSVVRRLTSLSWTHHQAVAALDPEAQDALLAKAEEHEMSVSALKDAVRAYKKALENGGEPPEEVVPMGTSAEPSAEAPKPKPKPKPKPVEEEEHPEYGKKSDHEEEVDPIEEWDKARAEIDRLHEELESLAVTDHAKEIRALHRRIQGLEGLLQKEMGEKNAAIDQIKYYQRIMGNLRSLLGVESNSDVHARVLELVQR